MSGDAGAHVRANRAASIVSSGRLALDRVLWLARSPHPRIPRRLASQAIPCPPREAARAVRRAVPSPRTASHASSDRARSERAKKPGVKRPSAHNTKQFRRSAHGAQRSEARPRRLRRRVRRGGERERRGRRPAAARAARRRLPRGPRRLVRGRRRRRRVVVLLLRERRVVVGPGGALDVARVLPQRHDRVAVFSRGRAAAGGRQEEQGHTSCSRNDGPARLRARFFWVVFVAYNVATRPVLRSATV